MEKNILEFASKWSRILFNAELGRKKIGVGSECGNSHRNKICSQICLPIEAEWAFRLFFLDFGGQSEILSSTGPIFHVSIIKSA
ncbi:hypothetical protein BV917_03900 [Leptospira santarosai serovar Guaricura]|nr:hypothetical protein BV917_03900 [Leptospira santarosai serovar Guaricura]